MLRLEPGKDERVSVVERLAAGKALRGTVPRASHGAWSTDVERPDPVDVLRSNDGHRLPDLLPLRYARMAATPFGFLRGSAAVMARDLASTPASGLHVQACGDAHLANFGAYGTPERQLVFDVNDFDETLRAPWEWDIKRLAASIVVAARTNGLKPAAARDAARAGVASYRGRMREYAQMPYVQLWYAELDAGQVLASLPRSGRNVVQTELDKAVSHDQLGALGHLSETVDGQLRIVDRPPLITHVADGHAAQRILQLHRGYLGSLQPDRRELVERYNYVDFARKVVGVGSVGTRCDVVLLLGSTSADPLFLQIKEATGSVLEPYAGKSSLDNHGHRVVAGQRRTQAAPDIFLGWGEVDGTQYYVRQLQDMKGSANIARMNAAQLKAYAELCGWALARAHARTGDPASIAGYLGRSAVFDSAVADFAVAYADQTERDHAALVAAIKAGKVPTQGG
jgi:uncharacterized protein (DUF2252 family)